jgi:hypothetical protein
MGSGAKCGPWRLLFGITFFVFGPCLLIAALISAHRTQVFLRSSESAPATVIQMHEFHNMNKTSWSYAPVFTFATDDGRTYTVASSLATYPPAFKVGQHATAHYQKGHPEQAKLESFTQLWLMDLINGIIGSISSLLLLFLLFARKGEPRIYLRENFPRPNTNS